MTERLNLTVSGNVQIVGYRKEVKKAAIQFNVLGHIMNQKDGTVKIVCEGKKENLKMFYDAIFIRKDDIYVDKIKKRGPARRRENSINSGYRMMLLPLENGRLWNVLIKVWISPWGYARTSQGDG